MVWAFLFGNPYSLSNGSYSDILLHMNAEEKIAWLLQNNRTMVLATADRGGRPWISPLFYTFDNKVNLYWVSDKDALHSECVRSNPRVGIVIYGKIPPEEYPDAVYFDAVAVELQDKEEITRAIATISRYEQAEKFRISSISDVTGGASWRIYKAVPKETTKREDTINEQTGQAVTIRASVNLSDVVQILNT